MTENLITKKYYYKYDDFRDGVKDIVRWLKPQREGYTAFDEKSWEPDLIVSINRGGLVAGVFLSHALDKPHYPISYQTRDNDLGYHDKSVHHTNMMPPMVDRDKKILLVDDINDSGKTFSDIMDFWVQKLNIPLEELREQIRTVSLIQRTGSSWAVDYTPKVLDTKQWVVFPWELII